MLGGSFRRFGTESYAISGTFWAFVLDWADAADIGSSDRAAAKRAMRSLGMQCIICPKTGKKLLRSRGGGGQVLQGSVDFRSRGRAGKHLDAFPIEIASGERHKRSNGFAFAGRGNSCNPGGGFARIGNPVGARLIRNRSNVKWR